MKTNQTKNAAPKAIFLDLDNTLLNRAKQVTAGNRAAIQDALAQGHKIIIATGRPLEASWQLAEQLGLCQPGCYLIAFNGAMVYDSCQKEIIYRNPIPRELAPPILAYARSIHLHMQFYDDWHTYVEPENHKNPEIIWYCERLHIGYRVCPIGELGKDPQKLLAISKDHPERLDALESWLDEHYARQIDHFHSSKELVEVVPKGMNKGAAVIQLCQQLSIPIANSIACGDEANDISMIRAAGIGVAMRNAVPEALAAADYITENDCDHDGIAEVIRKFML